jgi:hypothetical protein
MVLKHGKIALDFTITQDSALLEHGVAGNPVCMTWEGKDQLSEGTKAEAQHKFISSVLRVAGSTF